MNVRKILMAAVAAGCALATPTFATSIIPAEPEHVHSLNGTWHFKLEQLGTPQKKGSQAKMPIQLPEKLEPFQTPDYREDSSWKEMAVPGNWEMAGFSAATYGQPDNAIGLYRLEFDVPADWQGRAVKLNFDGVQNGAEVYLNGQPVNVDEPSEGKANFHQGGWDAFQADLTPHVKFGQKNLLAIRVYKNTRDVELDSGDYFFLGGIHRPVTLFSVPQQSRMESVKVETHLMPGDKAELKVIVNKAGNAAGGDVGISIDGKPVDATATQGGQGHTVLTYVMDKPKLWTAEHPNLYTLDVELKGADGKPAERVTRRIGVREVDVRDGKIFINNVPVKFTGICRHDVYPTKGTAVDEEVWRKDITLMKAANINAIRTSHYPYGSGFYDLCDELGMYVMDEEAACWCDPGDPKLADAFGQHARELVRRDYNHPSVVVWAIGNENKPGQNNRLAAEEIHKLDTTRPRLVSWRKGDEYGVELDDLHYTNPGKIAQLNGETERRKKYPMIFLENPNDWEEVNGADYGNLDAWGQVIVRTWNEVWKDEHVPGSFLWEWQDRAVCDTYPEKLYDYYPKTGINIIKVKGICDGFRNPRPDYYHVKMAYAPIVVDVGHVRVEGDTVIVHATNRYSFTNLSELKTTWHLIVNGKPGPSGDVHPALAPLSQGDLKFPFTADQLAQAEAVRLEFTHPDGRNVATYDVRLKPEADTSPKIDAGQLADVRFPHFNLVGVTWGKNQNNYRSAERHAGKLVNVKVQKAGGSGWQQVNDDAALYAKPLAEIGAVNADIVMSDETDAKPAGSVQVEFKDGRFAYQIKWTKADTKTNNNGKKNNGKNNNTSEGTDVQELGWAFHMPAAQDHFSWHRKADWSYYPETHIGRAAGTALPDSADVDVTKITRPDAFDFNSTKYHCDWVSLLDASGKGLGVICAPDARQQCRAGTVEGGSRVLIVNRYTCPPRDLSSGVVNDLYFMLKQGEAVESSFKVGAVR